jgi:anti-sigma factor ChrR (cupin superfamily)
MNMECQVKELLPEFVLGEATHHDINTVEAHLGSCAECRAEMALLQKTFVALVDELPQVQPQPTIQNKIFFEIDGRRRYDPFIDRVASLFDLKTSSAEGLLRGLDNSQWQPSPTQGITVLPVQAGPRLIKANTLLVKLQPHSRFPMHKHVNGEEVVLLLRGAYQDMSGEIVKRGQLVQLPDQHTHDLVALDGDICIGAVVHYGHDYL